MGNAFYEGGKGSVQGVVPLGTGSVSTQTKIIGAVPKDCRVTSIRVHQQAAITGTSLTAQVHARTAAGAAGNDLCSAVDMDVADAAAGKAGQEATLESTNPEHLDLDEGQLLEVVFTASSVTAGPGDALVEVEFEPRV